MNPRPRPATQGASLARSLHARAGVGVAAHVVQGTGLKILRLHMDRPALILVDRGIKTVQAPRGPAVRAFPGQALLIAGGQTVDFTNHVAEHEDFEARWLVFDGRVLDDAYYLQRSSPLMPSGGPMRPVQRIGRLRPGLQEAFERVRLALAPDAARPDDVVRQQVLEVLHWLLEEGLVVRSTQNDARTSDRIRALLGRRLDEAWTSRTVASALAMSEATLRRRLAAEGVSLSTLLVDVRMASALVQLQATTHAVARIAEAVGYASPSRFAVRFRERFGFPPTAVRGHARAATAPAA